MTAAAVSVSAGDAQPPVLLRYEAWPTRMFGTYTIRAIYSDGQHREVGHGLAQDRVAEAERRNRLVANIATPA